jgi:hypothetical protein
MSMWLLCGSLFLAIQPYVQGNPRAVIAAPLCFLPDGC